MWGGLRVFKAPFLTLLALFRVCKRTEFQFLSQVLPQHAEQPDELNLSSQEPDWEPDEMLQIKSWVLQQDSGSVSGPSTHQRVSLHICNCDMIVAIQIDKFLNQSTLGRSTHTINSALWLMLVV